MYRTTAEIVSGTRVYADGKWLRCIGNKRVSVGDRIWTDGRCVYGHEQEAQQPQVITAQEDDEGIPILIDQTLPVGDYLANKKSYYVYNSRLKTLKPPESLGFTGTEMINDAKRNAYLVSYDGASTFYATNIDKSGTVYKLIGTNTRIKIYKNEEEVSTISLSDLITRQTKETINSISTGSWQRNSDPSSTYKVFGRFAVIENENDWNVLLFLYTHGGQGLRGVDVDCSYNVYYNVAGEDSTWNYTVNRTKYATGSANVYVFTAYIINQDGYQELNRIQCDFIHFYRQEETIYDHWYGYMAFHPINPRTVILSEKISVGNASISSTNKDVKIPLQDGFYFTIDDYPNFPTNMFCYPIFMTISIYTKKNALLLTETFRTRSRITIGKIKSRYLIAVRHTTRFGIEILDINDELHWYSSSITNKDESEIFDNDRYNAYATETPYVDAGLYLYDGETLEKIADGTCLNARFRAMTKHKHWQNRMKQL